MLSQALDLEFGENFFPSTQDEEKDYYREPRKKSDIAVPTKQPKHFRILNKQKSEHLPEPTFEMIMEYIIWWNSKKDYIDAKYDYIINLVETMRKLCNCNNDKYSESSITLNALKAYLISVYGDDEDEEDEDEYKYNIRESFKTVNLTRDFNMFIYTFFMYYMRDVAYNKTQISFNETNKLLIDILQSNPFYTTIYIYLKHMALPEKIRNLDLEYNSQEFLFELSNKESHKFSFKKMMKLKEEAEKRDSEVQYNFQHLNDLMEKIDEFIINKGGEVDQDELEKYINEISLDFITHNNKVDLVDELISEELLGTRTKIVVNEMCSDKRSKIIKKIAEGI